MKALFLLLFLLFCGSCAIFEKSWNKTCADLCKKDKEINLYASEDSDETGVCNCQKNNNVKEC